MEEIRLSNVVLEYYPAKKRLDETPAIIICPGGAYATRSDFEGETVARYYAKVGFDAYVCQYSVGEQACMPHPLHQLATAVAKVRERSAFVAVCGFSAGGHLCASLCTGWHMAAKAISLPEASVRPDAAVLGYALTCYPANMPLQPVEAFAAVDGTGEAGNIPAYFLPALCETPDGQRLDFEAMSAAYLTGTDHPKLEQLQSISPAYHVSDDTPPAFIWANTPDPLVPCDHSIQYFQALQKHNVRSALHLFSIGGHGEGLAQDNPESSVWPELAASFLLSVRTGA